MTYRNKVYIAFDGDNDMHYYNLLEAWNANPNFDFRFANAHDLNTARDSSQEEEIKRQLRVRFANSKLFILLIGEHTKYLTKFVKWEIETAIKLELPIIAINLNGSRQSDSLEPNSLVDQLAIFIPFREPIIHYAMENWPDEDKQHRRNGEHNNFRYTTNIYNNLGL